jgi:CheY-like chemotaxis protein
MPVCRSPAGSASSPPDRTELGQLCVLVVEDDSDSREATVALLSSWGACVRGAGTADEAAELVADMAAQGRMPDALLTDHWLPDGRSSEDVDTLVRERMSALAPAKAGRLRTAVITGDIRSETRERIRLREWTFWQKPVRPAELHHWLGEVARQRLEESVH